VQMRKWARDAQAGALGVQTCACRGAVQMTPSCDFTCVPGHSLSYSGFPLLDNHLSYNALAVRGVEKVRE
jgi:hypothetical protein